MNRIAAHVLAALIVASVAFVAMSASVLAKENPGNHYGKDGNPGNHYGQISNPGHHYGQLKHSKTPSPTPNPNPNTQPVTQTGTGGGSTVTNDAATPSLADGGSTGSLPIALTLPSQNQTSGRFAPELPAANVLDWLILLILPALLAVWLIAGAGLTRNAARRIRMSRAEVPAPNPA